MADSMLCPNCMSVIDAGQKICPSCWRQLNQKNANWQLPIGTVLNKKYLVGRAIGGGGFGITYIGFDIILKIRVAIKEYYPTGSANRNGTAMVYTSSGESNVSFDVGKENFLNEAKVLSMFIDDENVVTMRDYFEANGTAYIVMEYLDGQDLREYLENNGRLSFNDALKLLEPAIHCLGRVHAKGIIHGDISPSNIMVLKNGEIRILDFGTARNQNKKEHYSASVMLKPGYAPEEQYRSNGEIGPWTDVYAISATLYKLITGVTPDNSTDRVDKDLLVPPGKLGAELSKAQDIAILKGMALFSKDRTRSMEGLLEDFNRNKLRLKDRLSSTGVKVFAGLAAAAVIAVAAVGAFAGNGGEELSASRGNTQSSSEVSLPINPERIPEKVELSSNAYPISICSGMEELEDFRVQELCNEGGVLAKVTNCYYGNGQLCLLLDISYMGDGEISVSRGYLNRGNIKLGAISDYTENYYDTLESGDTINYALWFNTDMMAVCGIDSFSALSVSVNFYGESLPDYGMLEANANIYMPGNIRIESGIDRQGTMILSIPEYGVRVDCYGLSLRKNNCRGELLVRVSFTGDNCSSANIGIYGDGIFANGTKVFGDYYTEYVSSYIFNDICYYAVPLTYGYGNKTDEMNVMYSDTPMPETVSLNFVTTLNVYDDEVSGETLPSIVDLNFAVDEYGVGQLQ